MTDRERSLDEVIAGIQPEIFPVEPKTSPDETALDVALQEIRGATQLDTVIAAIEPVISDYPYTRIEAIIPEPTQPEGVIDVARDAEIGAAAGYLAQLVRKNQWAVRTAEGIIPTKADYTSRSGLVEREERIGRTGKAYEKLHLTDRGTQAVDELEAMVQGSTAYSRESYDNVKAYLKEVYETVKAQYASKPDRQIKNAQLAVARRVISEVRSNASKAYKAREKEVRQAPAREFIAVAIAHLGIANLAQEADLKNVYAYLRTQKTDENASLVASARQIARLEHQKAQVEVEAQALAEVEQARLAQLAEARREREAAIAKKTRKIEWSLRRQALDARLALSLKLGSAALVATLAVAGLAQVVQSSEARRVQALPTAVSMLPVEPLAKEPQTVALAEQSVPQNEVVPVTVKESGPISLHVRYTNESGAQDVQLGYKGVDPAYKFFSVNGLTRAQQIAELKRFSAAASKMGPNEIVGLEYGDVLFDVCHSAMYLDRQACGALVRLSEELSDPKTGKPKTEKPVILEKRDSKARSETAQTVGWVRVPRYIKDVRTGKMRQRTVNEYIAYVRTYLPGVRFDGITSTCYIAEGKVVNPNYFLATVTRRIPVGQVPAEYRPQQQNGEHMYTKKAAQELQKERVSIISRARNAVRSPWEIAKARAARKIARVG